MPKTQLSKSELIDLYRRLVLEKAFPIKKIKVYENVLDSTSDYHLTDIDFLSENNNVYRFTLISKTEPKCYKLKEQLEEYFI